MVAANLQSIQWLRGIAVIAVMCFHLGFFSKGFLGVDLFFAISGFVILNSINRKNLFVENQKAKKDFFFFLKKRFMRIYPALLIVITVTLLYSLVQVTWLNQSQKNVSKFGVSSIFSVANFFSYQNATNYFDAGNTSKPLLHLWSVSVEIQLYILFAIIMMFLSLLKIKEEIRDLIIFVVFLASFIFSNLYSTETYAKIGFNSPENLGFYSPLNRVWEFLFGSLIYILYFQIRSKAQNLIYKICTIFTIILLLVVLDSNFLKITLILFFVFIHFGRNLKFNSVLSPIAKIGDRSYSIYLWHMPIIFFFLNSRSSALNLILAILLTIVFGHFTYEYVEQKYRSSGIKPNLIRATSLGLILSLSIVALNFGIPEKVVALKFTQIDISNEHLSTGGWEEPFGNCVDKNVFNNICTRTTNFLDNLIVGDSHAGAFVQVQDLTYENQPYLFKKSIIHPGCSIILPGLSENSECNAAKEKIEKSLSNESDLKIFYSEDYQLYGSLYEQNLGNLGCTAYMKCAYKGYKESNYSDLLIKELIKLNSINNQEIVLIGAAPRLVGWPNQFNLWNLLLKEQNEIYSEYSNEVAKKINEDLSQRVKNLQSQGTKIRFIDPLKYICLSKQNNRCRVYSKKTSSLYWDADHLSVAGAQTVFSGEMNR